MGEVVSRPAKTLGVYTHIEKTAGTSVRDALETTVGTSDLYLYSADGKSFARAKDGRPGTSAVLDKVVALGLSHPATRPLLVAPYAALHGLATRRMLAKSSKDVPDDASVIMGHFVADQFDEAIGERPMIRAVTIREPVSRLVSHYDDWKRLKGHHDWRVQVPYDPAMTFEDFAALPEMQNYQTKALGRLGLEDFDVVGVTENVDQSVGQFLGLLAEAGTVSSVPNTDDLHLGHYNRSAQSRKTNVEALGGSVLQTIQAYNAADIELYAQARAMSMGTPA